MGFKDMALYQDMTPVLLYAAVFSSLGAFTFGYGGATFTLMLGTG